MSSITERNEALIMSHVALRPGVFYAEALAPLTDLHPRRVHYALQTLEDRGFVDRDVSRRGQHVARVASPSGKFWQVANRVNRAAVPVLNDGQRGILDNALESRIAMCGGKGTDYRRMTNRGRYLGLTEVLGEQVNPADYSPDWPSEFAGWRLLVDLKSHRRLEDIEVVGQLTVCACGGVVGVETA